MSEGARVESIDALKAFKAALWKFAEAAGVALGDAETEMQRLQNWLETEQLTYWQTQIRKRHDAVERAKEAVRMKKLFKDSSGRTPTAVEEEKALRVAILRFEEAEQKLAAVRRWIPKLQKEAQSYKGGVQRLETTLQSDIPRAAARLENMLGTLEAYVELDASVDAAPPPGTGEDAAAAPADVAEAPTEAAEPKKDAAAG